MQHNQANWKPLSQKRYPEDRAPAAQSRHFAGRVFRISKNIRDLNGLPLQQDSPGYSAASRCKPSSLRALLEIRRQTVARSGVVASIRFGWPEDLSRISLAQTCSRLDQRIKHLRQIKRRAANYLENFGSGSLLLQRLAQFVEQPRVLDGDNGLGGEILQQFNLFVGEGAHLLAIDRQDAD